MGCGQEAGDFQAVAGHAGHATRVAQQLHAAHAHLAQDLRANAVGAQVHLRGARRFGGLGRQQLRQQAVHRLAAVQRALLAHHGIEACLGEDAALRTIVKLRVIGRSQQLLRIDFESEPDHEVLTQALDAFERELPQHDAVLFSDYGKGGLTHITRMIESARAAGKPVLVDPKGSDYARYAGATVITPNRGELAQVVGAWRSDAQLIERAQALRSELRVGSLLLTRSEDGMSLFDEQGAVHQPAQTREVFDVTGAGDTVIATMAVLLAAGLTAREAMPHANRAGGLVVGKFGTASVSHAELFG